MKLTKRSMMAGLLAAMVAFCLPCAAAFADGGAVAKIGSTAYGTLQAAMNAAEDGQTVVLQKETTENVILKTGKSITLDLNGKTLTAEKADEGAEEQVGLLVSNGKLSLKNGNLTAQDMLTFPLVLLPGWQIDDDYLSYSASATLTDVHVSALGAIAVGVASKSDITINSGTYVSTYESEAGGELSASLLIEDATATIKGGVFGTASKACPVYGVGQSSLLVEGGTFNGDVVALDNSSGGSFSVEISGGKFSTADNMDSLVAGKAMRKAADSGAAKGYYAVLDAAKASLGPCWAVTSDEGTVYFESESEAKSFAAEHEGSTMSFAKGDISSAKVTLSKKNLAYNGKSRKPSVKSVVCNGKTLKAGTDYTVAVKGGKRVGTYKVTVAGKGSYAGKAVASYTIGPKAVAKLKVKAAKKGFKATWKRVKAERSGVQVRYSLKKSMAKAKTVKAKGAGAKAKKVRGLKGKKRYYVQARAYKVVGGKTYCSAWSKAKKVKTK